MASAPAEKVRVRCGPSRTPQSLTVHQLLGRWASDRAKVSVTDFHIRGTGIMKRIDCSHLSSFNLLAGAPDPIGTEEILTMVVSSAGTLSDSHTDDPDGSNHCFAGEKLWLVWDTFQGLAQGLEDVERCDVFGNRAAFSLRRIPGSARVSMVCRQARSDAVSSGTPDAQGHHAGAFASASAAFS